MECIGGAIKVGIKQVPPGPTIQMKRHMFIGVS
jgi:hypothetical protein